MATITLGIGPHSSLLFSAVEVFRLHGTLIICVYNNYHKHWTVEDSDFGAVSLCFLFVYEISLEPLNGFAPNSHGRRFMVPRSDEFEGQGQISKVKVTRDTKTAFFGPNFGFLRAMCAW